MLMLGRRCVLTLSWKNDLSRLFQLTYKDDLSLWDQRYTSLCSVLLDFQFVTVYLFCFSWMLSLLLVCCALSDRPVSPMQFSLKWILSTSLLVIQSNIVVSCLCCALCYDSLACVTLLNTEPRPNCLIFVITLRLLPPNLCSSLVLWSVWFIACGSVAKWVGCRTCNQQVVGSNCGHCAVECNPGQVVDTCVPLSPTSIIGTS